MKKNSWIKKQKEDAELVFAPEIHYDKEHDILSITWFPKFNVDYSIETKSGFVFDISKEKDVKGIEIFDFKEKIKKGDGE